ncbi:D-2-hydroxyacid dehydrogenase [Cryobacterium sp.]|jgi:phosphoglycerate dehydrogenase-like enzyme|uniref:D-2-hydroxyacid dehydrogenase n=1 Tax=Cryobacterium sp. TaxID=1926290 RepID=UPI00260C9B0D|nr:D-2-hydroxyacid dehydrogenase [Cryobacterium sp.]MCU1444564.1 4-phosphoerythronate dehydrogenase [Cryobacterium sp.]
MTASSTPASPSSSTLRVVVASPLSEEDCRLIEQAEPRIELVRDQSLLPPMRHPADHNGDPAFQRTPHQQAAFERLLDSADALYGIPDVDPAALRRTVEANPKLRWVQLMAAGGGAQVKAAGLSDPDLARVAFTTSAGVHGGPLAEFALLGILAGAKQLPRLQADQRAHEWPGRRPLGQLRGQTVLLAGLGGIGREIARLTAALGMHVIGTRRPGSSTTAPFVDEYVSIDDLAGAAGRADAIVISLPGTTATDRLVGAAVFEAARPGITVVNVGRGTVIDEDALVAALQNGQVGFAALDVFVTEPLPAASELWDLPNVLVSPHTAALDPREERRIAELFTDNATRLLNGTPLRNTVNTVEFY